MKTTRTSTKVASVALAALGSMLTLASDVETSASATGGRYGAGTATGTARYAGDVGFARTDTRTGEVNAARSVAVGVDPNGLSLSWSLALAPNRGPALATNFNMSIGADGQVAASNGLSLAEGGRARTVTAGGATGSGPFGSSAASLAGGSTAGGGVVHASANSDSSAAHNAHVVRVPVVPPSVLDEAHAIVAPRALRGGRVVHGPAAVVTGRRVAVRERPAVVIRSVTQPVASVERPRAQIVVRDAPRGYGGFHDVSSERVGRRIIR